MLENIITKQVYILVLSFGAIGSLWSSKDLALVIITAVVVFVFSVTIFQIPRLLTGNGGLVYINTIGMAFLISITCLLFQGRRWRFFAHNTLVAILSIPTSFAGAPFDVFPRIVVIIAGIFVDLIINSFYQKFEKKNRLMWWSIFTCLIFFSVLPLIQIIILPVYFSPQYMKIFSDILILMSPWIIGGAIGGGYFGYKTYQRIAKRTDILD